MEYTVINYLFDKGEAVSEGICFTSQSKVTGLYKHSFFPLAIVMWNALPETVACLPDLESFKVAVSKLQHTRP